MQRLRHAAPVSYRLSIDFVLSCSPDGDTCCEKKKLQPIHSFVLSDIDRAGFCV